MVYDRTLSLAPGLLRPPSPSDPFYSLKANKRGPKGVGPGGRNNPGANDITWTTYKKKIKGP